MNASVCIFSLIIISSVFGNDDNNAKLRFYYNSIDNYTELGIHEAHNIFSYGWYDPDRTTIIFCHGFTGHPNGPAVTAVINSYLENGDNVVLLNWDRLAAAVLGTMSGSYLNWAMPNAKTLGVNFAETLFNLSAAGLDLNKTHLIGHSLGAHIFGITGNTIAQKGFLLPWITGLDPAAVGFDNNSPLSRLNEGSARYVSVIHSDPNKYGYRRSLGTVDFWPNYRAIGPVIQPGCDNLPHPKFSQGDLCNHNRCWQILIDSLKYPESLLGSYAKNYKKWKNYSVEQKNAIVLEIGKFYENVTPGDYYFVTRPESPYGLGRNGL